MKKDYDLKRLKRRSKVKVDPSAAKVPTSIRVDGGVLAWFKAEAQRLGIPYQTLIGSVLYRFAHFELLDKTEVEKLIGKKS